MSRYYIDNGCIFVGHGLTKDFETANISVPSNQVNINNILFNHFLLIVYMQSYRFVTLSNCGDFRTKERFRFAFLLLIF